METTATRWGLRVWIALVLAFLYVPLAIIMVYAFNKSNVQSWPIPGFTTHWFRVAWDNHEVRDALWLSVRVALVAMGAAVLLGSAAAFAAQGSRAGSSAPARCWPTRSATPGRRGGCGRCTCRWSVP